MASLTPWQVFIGARSVPLLVIWRRILKRTGVARPAYAYQDYHMLYGTI